MGKNYGQRIQVPEGEIATEKQIIEYRHNREYELSVFNRSQILRFSYLCTNPNDDEEPGVYLSTSSKGIKLNQRKNPHLVINPIFGVPIPVTITRAFIISILVVIACGVWIENIWVASCVSMIVGLAGQQVFGAIEYKVERFIIKAVTG